MSRVLSERQISGLKGVTEASFVEGGGVTSFASMTRVSVSQLSKYASQSADNKGYLAGIDIAVEADMRAGQPIIVAEMARLLGYRLVREDAPATPPGLSEHDALVLSIKSGKLAGIILDALTDHRVDTAEYAEIVGASLDVFKQVECILLAARAAR
jgi:hypothetical protein